MPAQGDAAPRRRNDGVAEPLLRVRSLARQGLADASFALEAGRCLAISGASGSGKTLLLRAIADLDPNHGEVLLAGQRRSAMPAPRWRRRVVYVAAEAGWWADGVGAHFQGHQAASALLAELGLPEDALGWAVMRLSTGERQRLALARAVALAPDVLLLDEPTSGLDPEATRAVEALLRRELARGAALILVSHDVEQVARLGDRRMEMMDGVLRDGAEAGAQTAASP